MATPKPAGASATHGNFNVAVDLLDGKTEQQFYKDFFTIASLKSDGKMVTKVINRTLVQSFIDGGFVFKGEDGVFHKVEDTN